ncbi:hypothetical protein [Sporichthya sp.]|uniref:hypothetical protein n=1 Tax=Sporichthya sp. TaxID=65475 RepID=UPI0025E0FE6C|nr:hypothetical protein [Sporichthya sp.]
MITTRRNQRRIIRADGGHVRNGDRWRVVALQVDGSLDAVPAGPEDRNPGSAVRLPADYVRDHVELGYALTVHRAQGVTADTSHLLVREGMAREALYVAMTRGRHANHAYIVTDTGGAETHVAPKEPTGRQILETVLRSPGSATSATSALRRRQASHVLAASPTGLWPPRPAAETTRARPDPAPRRPPPPGMTR